MPLEENRYRHHPEKEKGFWERKAKTGKGDGAQKREEEVEEKKKNFDFEDDPESHPNPNCLHHHAASFCWLLTSTSYRRGKVKEARYRKERIRHSEEEKKTMTSHFHSFIRFVLFVLLLNSHTFLLLPFHPHHLISDFFLIFYFIFFSFPFLENGRNSEEVRSSHFH